MCVIFYCKILLSEYIPKFSLGHPFLKNLLSSKINSLRNVTKLMKFPTPMYSGEIVKLPYMIQSQATDGGFPHPSSAGGTGARIPGGSVLVPGETLPRVPRQCCGGVCAAVSHPGTGAARASRAQCQGREGAQAVYGETSHPI